MIYIDSSVALAYLLAEPRSPSTRLWQESLTSSALLEYEVWTRVNALDRSGSLGEAPVFKRADILLSAAPLEDDGVLLRVAGTSAQQVGGVLKQHLSFLPSLLGDDPWTSKF